MSIDLAFGQREPRLCMRARDDQKPPQESGAQVSGSALHRYLQLIQLYPCAHATHAHAAFLEPKELVQFVIHTSRLAEEFIVFAESNVLCDT
jgi:hypothetical protein